MSARRRSLLSALLTAALLVGAAGVAAPAQAKGKLTHSSVTRCQEAASSPKGVLMVGDSLTYNSAAQMMRTLTARGYVVCLNGRTGRTTGQGADVIAAYAAAGKLPPTIVVGLGTNDPFTPAADFAGQVERIRTLAGPTRHLLWVNAFRRTNPTEIAGIKRVNAEIARQAALDPAMRTLDWHKRALAHPGYVKADDIHLTPAGNDARIALVAAGLAGLRP